MRNFGLSDYKPIPPDLETMSSDQSNKDLLKRIKELEAELRDEKIKATGYKKMIEIAEHQFKIPIQKKPYTKQSKK
jgi:cell division septum initiation protein DivIVA